jgi:cell division protein FtsB
MDLRVSRLSKIRQFPRPEEGLRALVDRAPQAEAWADRLTERLRPAMTAIYQARRRLATGAVAVLTLWLFVHVMFGANGMVVYRQKQAEYQDLRQQVDQLQKESDAYTARIKALKTDPNTIEKEAREQLGYTRAGEKIFVTPTVPVPQPPAMDRAHK